MRAFSVCASVELADELRAVPALWGEKTTARPANDISSYLLVLFVTVGCPGVFSHPPPLHFLAPLQKKHKDSTVNLADLQHNFSRGKTLWRNKT